MTPPSPARIPRPADGGERLAGGWPAPDRRGLMANAAYAVGARRALLGVVLAAVGLPLLTALLVAARPDLSLTDDLLIYLVAVVALAVIGGFWPAVLAAASASLLLNWYFTPPLHTFTIDKPDNLLALLLFVTVAVAVSSVVHLAASRAGRRPAAARRPGCCWRWRRPSSAAPTPRRRSWITSSRRSGAAPSCRRTSAAAGSGSRPAAAPPPGPPSPASACAATWRSR